ncbi:hypothetical protein, unlikely [Trypanosoma brucei brucei TREU927]|uniref:Uncharacterized protein n=1 Tax=Trypanosoma brucei brucei (strain 927/4 GUTat10.1) TaxID=185431 RepID=Q38G21_TRYB2|nr:hypothetical protein, unlikely [Trypanosoma brucei brucei TREU927]EAN76249.1 hypothetical protein, unlikely [Trypanosoma brucei brucei TREU927]
MMSYYVFCCFTLYFLPLFSISVTTCTNDIKKLFRLFTAFCLFILANQLSSRIMIPILTLIYVNTHVPSSSLFNLCYTMPIVLSSYIFLIHLVFCAIIIIILLYTHSKNSPIIIITFITIIIITLPSIHKVNKIKQIEKFPSDTNFSYVITLQSFIHRPQSYKKLKNFKFSIFTHFIKKF